MDVGQSEGKHVKTSFSVGPNSLIYLSVLITFLGKNSDRPIVNGRPLAHLRRNYQWGSFKLLRAGLIRDPFVSFASRDLSLLLLSTVIA